jgi:hypothetical protein
VAFYAYFLARIFRREIEKGLMAMGDVGYIWLQPSDASAEITSTMQPFQLKPWLQLVERHMLYDIPRALSGAIEDVAWHLSLQCAPCPYLEDCRTPTQHGMDIRALPHVSRADSQHLQSAALAYSAAPSKQVRATKMNTTAPAKFSVQTLRVALTARVHQNNPDTRAAQVLGEVLSPGLLASVLDDRCIVNGHFCDSFPSKSAGTELFLSLACDPANDLPYSFALCAVDAAAGRVVASDEGFALWTKDPAELRRREEALLVRFLSSLCAILCGQAVSGAPALVIYVSEGIEKYCLSQLIVKALCGECSRILSNQPAQLRVDLHYAALVILDYAEQWQLLEVPSSAAAVTAACAGSYTPRVCDVTSAYRTLVYLPIAGFFQARDIYKWLQGHNETAGGFPSGAAEQIALDGIERLWLSADSSLAATVRARLDALRFAAQFLSGTVTAVNSALLPNAAPPLPVRPVGAATSVSTGDSVLQRLQFMKAVDVTVRCGTARQKRIAALNSGANTTIATLRYLRESPRFTHCFALERGEVPAVAGSSGAFIKKSCLCARDEQLLSLYADYAHLTETMKCPDDRYTFGSVVEITSEPSQSGDAPVMVVEVSTTGRTAFVEGRMYFLFEREADLNMSRTFDSLAQAVARRTPSTFVDVVRDPNAWSRAFGTDKAAATFAAVGCAPLSQARVAVDAVYRQHIGLTGGSMESPFASVGPLTRVQLAAFDKLLHERLTVMWGPPGTQTC